MYFKQFIESALDSLPVFSGPAYSADTGYEHDRRATAADVVRYEIEELGNQHQVAPEVMDELGRIPARKLIWVTTKKSHARRYGKPEQIQLPTNSRIIANDPDGGFLVLMV